MADLEFESSPQYWDFYAEEWADSLGLNAVQLGQFASTLCAFTFPSLDRIGNRICYQEGGSVI